MIKYPLLRQQIERVIQLTDDEYVYIENHFTEKKLRRHQFLVQEGESVSKEYFVLEGCLKTYHLSNEGKESILQFALEDWWTTDFEAYFKQAPATVYIDCLEESRLLGLTLDDREKISREMHKMEHYFRVISNAHSVALHRRVLSLLTMDAKQRHDQLLELYPSFFQRIPKKWIAAYLGVSRETLSRFKK